MGAEIFRTQDNNTSFIITLSNKESPSNVVHLFDDVYLRHSKNLIFFHSFPEGTKGGETSGKTKTQENSRKTTGQETSGNTKGQETSGKTKGQKIQEIRREGKFGKDERRENSGKKKGQEMSGKTKGQGTSSKIK